MKMMSPRVFHKSISHDGIPANHNQSNESLLLLNGHNSYSKGEGGVRRRRSYSTSLVTPRPSRRKLLRRVSESLIPNCVLVPNRNPLEELYRLFPQLPPGEKPYNAYTCALHKDILLQGKLIICTNCICFHSNIFGYETRLVIYFKNVSAIRREKTAFVVPNAVSIRTIHKRYLFCSFLSRESVFKLLSRVWQASLDPNVKDIHNELADEALQAGRRKREKRKKSTDYNHNRNSSPVYESTTGATITQSHDILERPHTSPPSLNNSPETVSILNANRKLYKKLEDITNTESDELDDDEDDEVFTFNGGGVLAKANSLSDLRELANVSDRIGHRNVEKIGKEMLARHKRKDGSQRSCSIFSPTITLATLFQIYNRIRLKYPAMFVISLLVLILAFVSFGLLLRINAITNTLYEHTDTMQSSSSSSSDKLEHLFQYRDNIHTAKVERMKSILSVNLETVNEVQETLRKLREKLQE